MQDWQTPDTIFHSTFYKRLFRQFLTTPEFFNAIRRPQTGK